MPESERVEIAGVTYWKDRLGCWRDQNDELMTDSARFPASEALSHITSLEGQVEGWESASKGFEMERDEMRSWGNKEMRLKREARAKCASMEVENARLRECVDALYSGDGRRWEIAAACFNNFWPPDLPIPSTEQ